MGRVDARDGGGVIEHMNLNGKKVMITTGGGIGDNIMYTPSLRRMKELYPQMYLTFLTRYPNHRILEGLSYIDKLVYIKRGTLTSRIRVISDMIGLDAVVFTEWQPQLIVAAKLLRIPIIAAYPRKGHFLTSFLTKYIVTDVMKSHDFAAETNAKLFSEVFEIAIDGDMTHTDVGKPTADEELIVKKRLNEKGVTGEYIVLSAFAGLKERNWPIEQAKLFANQFEEKYGIPVLWSGSKENKATLLSEGIPKNRNIAGETTVGEMIALIKNASLLVTPDSGPMHLVGALGTPMVSLFSKDLPSRWAPKKHNISITLSLPCVPCNDDTARNCPHNLLCMKGITASMVMDAVEKIIEK